MWQNDDSNQGQMIWTTSHYDSRTGLFFSIGWMYCHCKEYQKSHFDTNVIYLLHEKLTYWKSNRNFCNRINKFSKMHSIDL